MRQSNRARSSPPPLDSPCLLLPLSEERKQALGRQHREPWLTVRAQEGHLDAFHSLVQRPEALALEAHLRRTARNSHITAPGSGIGSLRGVPSALGKQPSG